jgi:carboxymethylenebutenolidase
VCFDLDSSPPIPVISGAAVAHDDLVLEARDGNRFAAFLATPEELSGKGVVILPDVRGLYRFYEELALRFAERGYTALTFDYFGRTAGAEKRGEEFEYRPHVEAVTPEQIQADVAAAVEQLRSLGVQSVFTVGFCMGGRQSWLAAAAGHGLAGAVGFYGRPGAAADGSPGPEQLVSKLEAPLLALQAGADQNITADDNEAFEQSLSDAGVEHELVVYEGAPHSFFDRKQDEFAGASEDAWNRTLEFIERHGK